jgi:hypothetical protein
MSICTRRRKAAQHSNGADAPDGLCDHGAAARGSFEPLDRTGHMLSFEQIRQHVQQQHKQLLLDARVSDAIYFYELHGGQEVRPWRVAGVYVQVDREQRLILEALHSPDLSACAIRVYFNRDGSIKIHYARKVSTQIAHLPDRLNEATEEFLKHVPERVLPRDHSVRDRFGSAVESALLPISPPVVFAELKE